MHYEINVSKKAPAEMQRGRHPSWGPLYQHCFATAERSCQTHGDMLFVYAKLREAFPSPEYNITVTYVTTTGKEQDNDVLDKQAKAQGWLK